MEFRNEDDEVVRIIHGVVEITQADGIVYYQAWVDGMCLGSGSKDKAFGHLDDYYTRQDEKAAIRDRPKDG